MSSAKEKLLDTAEQLFHQNGYDAISMRDIASALDMKKGSLYYHAPQGKEQLYVQVTERLFRRHHRGIKNALEDGLGLEDTLYRVARWIFSQPPIFLFKMMDGDVANLSSENATHLARLAHELIFTPLVLFFEENIAQGSLRPHRADMLTGTFLTLMEGVSFAQRNEAVRGMDLDTMIDETITILVHGIKQDSRALLRPETVNREK